MMNFTNYDTVNPLMKPLSCVTIIALVLSCEGFASDAAVVIQSKPTRLVSESLDVPITTTPAVARVELIVNGVKSAEKPGPSPRFTIPVGKYIRRLRVRVVGYDQLGVMVGEDEMVVNDPEPPFRVRLLAPAELPASGSVTLSATVTAPSNLIVSGVDFFVGDSKVETDLEAPFTASFDVASHPSALYAQAIARARGDLETNDLHLWGSIPRDSVEVVLHQLPISVQGNPSSPLRAGDLTLKDASADRAISDLIPASDQPLNVIMLVDASESIAPELPVIKEAARTFARSLIRPTDRLAVVAFNQRRIWLTGFTSDINQIGASLERIKPIGQTHLYDAVIEMLFELQKLPGRRALVVLTDGVNQGGTFELDHLVHYSRYAGVPIYPIVKNRLLSRFLRFGLGMFEAKRFADIARDSGASHFIIQSPAELAEVYRRVGEELQNQYLLMFYSEASLKDEWRSLQVKSNRRDIRIRAPKGYFP